MKRTLFFGLMAALLMPLTLKADSVVGEPSPLTDGTPDGWSGVSVMNGYGGIPAGDMVTAVNYFGNPARADGEANVQPLIVQQDADNAYTIWEVGPVAVAAEAENTISWGSAAVPSDGLTYHPAFWQWRNGVDNTDGGVVSFTDGTGGGMFQFDADGTSYVPMVGDVLTEGHASGEGGRAYQMNFETQTVPEPASLVLAACALLPVMLLRRRKK